MPVKCPAWEGTPQLSPAVFSPALWHPGPSLLWFSVSRPREPSTVGGPPFCPAVPVVRMPNEGKGGKAEGGPVTTHCHLQAWLGVHITIVASLACWGEQHPNHRTQRWGMASCSARMLTLRPHSSHQVL